MALATFSDVLDRPIAPVRAAAYLAFGFLLFVATVCWPEPRYISLPYIVLSALVAPGPGALVAGAIGPLLSPVASFMLFPLRWMGHRAALVASRILLGLVLTASALDFAVALAVVFGAKSDADAGTGLAYMLVSASLLAWTILIGSLARDLDMGEHVASIPNKILASVIGLVAVWSVVSGIAAAAQADSIAGNSAYCISSSSAGSVQLGDPISLLGLRGSNLALGATLAVREEPSGQFHYWIWSAIHAMWRPAPEMKYATFGETHCGAAQHFVWGLL